MIKVKMSKGTNKRGLWGVGPWTPQLGAETPLSYLLNELVFDTNGGIQFFLGTYVQPLFPNLGAGEQILSWKWGLFCHKVGVLGTEILHNFQASRF